MRNRNTHWGLQAISFIRKLPRASIDVTQELVDIQETVAAIDASRKVTSGRLRIRSAADNEAKGWEDSQMKRKIKQNTLKDLQSLKMATIQGRWPYEERERERRMRIGTSNAILKPVLTYCGD